MNRRLLAALCAVIASGALAACGGTPTTTRTDATDAPSGGGDARRRPRLPHRPGERGRRHDVRRRLARALPRHDAAPPGRVHPQLLRHRPSLARQLPRHDQRPVADARHPGRLPGLHRRPARHPALRRPGLRAGLRLSSIGAHARGPARGQGPELEGLHGGHGQRPRPRRWPRPAPTRRSGAPTAPSAPPPADQYATRHNPFVYFHSIIDRPATAPPATSRSPRCRAISPRRGRRPTCRSSRPTSATTAMTTPAPTAARAASPPPTPSCAHGSRGSRLARLPARRAADHHLRRGRRRQQPPAAANATARTPRRPEASMAGRAADGSARCCSRRSSGRARPRRTPTTTTACCVRSRTRSGCAHLGLRGDARAAPVRHAICSAAAVRPPAVAYDLRLMPVLPDPYDPIRKSIPTTDGDLTVSRSMCP